MYLQQIKTNNQKQSKMMNKIAMNIFIPRILPNISKYYIKHTFNEVDFGNVVYIDMRKRINLKNKIYYFAFIKIEMTDNQNIKMTKLLETENENRLYYTDQDYWELKPHIPHEEREIKGHEIAKLCKELITKPSHRDIYPTSFTKEDLCNMNLEYGEIERDISNIMKFENDIYIYLSCCN
jgi:hypothetical protein